MATRWLPSNGRSTAIGGLPPGRSSHTPLDVAAHRLLSRSQLSEVTLPPGCQARSWAFRLSSPIWMTLPCPLMPARYWGVSGASSRAGATAIALIRTDPLPAAPCTACGEADPDAGRVCTVPSLATKNRPASEDGTGAILAYAGFLRSAMPPVAPGIACGSPLNSSRTEVIAEGPYDGLVSVQTSCAATSSMVVALAPMIVPPRLTTAPEPSILTSPSSRVPRSEEHTSELQ